MIAKRFRTYNVTCQSTNGFLFEIKEEEFFTKLRRDEFTWKLLLQINNFKEGSLIKKMIKATTFDMNMQKGMHKGGSSMVND